ncbi:MAG: hypothetical protein QOI08_126 [Actinomycetota bacterium]|jgi:hypothetical protein|nr:hypothetical protein [Actinomycetota bacterium]
MRRAVCAPALAVAALVGLGACGSSSPSSSSSTTTNNSAAIGATTTAPGGSSSAVTSPTTVPASTGPEVSPSGDIPDNQAFVKYASARGTFSLQVPEGWARTDTGGVTIFASHYNSIRVAPTQRAVARSAATARSIDVPALQGREHAFALRNLSEVTRPAGTVVLITYRAQSAADPVTGKSVVLDVERYEYWRNGTSVTLTLSAPTGSDNVDPWKKVTDSFAWSA